VKNVLYTCPFAAAFIHAACTKDTSALVVTTVCDQMRPTLKTRPEALVDIVEQQKG